MGYTNSVLLYRFLSVSLLLIELGVVYGVTAIASAALSPVVQEEQVVLSPVRREVRLVVVSSNQEEISEDSAERSNSSTNDNNEEVIDVKSEDLTDTEKEMVTKGVASRPDSESMNEEVSTENVSMEMPKRTRSQSNIPTVPFYSQFANITSPTWQKVGCGIASLAMIIDHYSKENIVVDDLLDQGIRSGAYISSAGWSHAGLIGLSRAYGLDGKTISWSDLAIDDAFTKLQEELENGPVMASVHYTFEPTNPIPHLVVIIGVDDGKVFYNDPAEKVGGGSLSIEKFQRAWKKRYISIRPV